MMLKLMLKSNDQGPKDWREQEERLPGRIFKKMMTRMMMMVMMMMMVIRQGPHLTWVGEPDYVNMMFLMPLLI